jgi:hypothetical protein
LRPAAGLWDSDSRPRAYLSEYMRVSLSIFALIASWLCAVPSASAAARPERTCSPIARVSEARAAAAAHTGCRVKPSFARRMGLGDTRSSLRHGTSASDSDDDAVIQDEAPAARIDAGDGVPPALRPLGTLAATSSTLPVHRILSRRSPRGPPAF